MRTTLATILLVCLCLVCLAGLQQLLLVGNFGDALGFDHVSGQEACERPGEIWLLTLDELKEDGVIRTTEKAYEPWAVSIRRAGDDTIKLMACRPVAGKQECYDQEYIRRFGGTTTAVSKP